MTEVGRRGPKRNEQARIAILQATSARVLENGYDQLTIEGVAADARVSKQTIYRWWPSRSALVAECLAERMLLTEFFVPEDSGDLRADVIRWLENIIGFLGSPGNSGLLRSLLIAATENTEVATHLNERLGMWEMLGERFTAAIEADQLPADTPLAELGDALMGALVVRDLRGAGFDNGFAKNLAILLLPA
ncbi:TetR/AcrR family transcriptional regulator [Leucobacter viscericola]|uniref:TetR/AcrR family transcriptional regulator n=1 Tax=Leucobacter viscericola TaxID=2714935 RepID=A0A6G7XGH4_9MICO|nr:TetR/AcrR family transcriptional regulator [Leucobacter viscericola]QIK63566.1 TetR/AcrR family transcriptional regulator [Leucobacter viscericola]